MRSELKNKLEAYATQAKNATRRARLGSIPALATATGAALAMTTSAEADIIYSGIENVTVTASTKNTARNLSLNIQSPKAAGSTLKFNVVLGHGLEEITGTGKNPPHTQFFSNGYALMQRFGFGATIKGDHIPPTNSGAIVHINGGMGGSGGLFTKSVTGYAGFVLSDNEHGWIRLKWSSSSSTELSLTVIDWAYNNRPGGIITAGEGITSVPEPSSLSLALLAAGSGGVLALRKRGRSAAQSKKQEAKVSTL